MAEEIEIRSTGEVVVRHLPIGRITFDTPYPREFEGKWYSGESGDYGALVIECNEMEERAEKAESIIVDAVSALEQILEDEREIPYWLEKRIDHALEVLE